MKDRSNAVFGVLNLAQAALIGAVPMVAPSREPLVNWVLGAAAVVIALAGPALVFAGRPGRIYAAVACLIHWLLGTVLSALIIASASYLYGIYGRHGHSIGSIAFVLAFMVLVAFWLIPLHELNFLRKKRVEKS